MGEENSLGVLGSPHASVSQGAAVFIQPGSDANVQGTQGRFSASLQLTPDHCLLCCFVFLRLLSVPGQTRPQETIPGPSSHEVLGKAAIDVYFPPREEGRTGELTGQGPGASFLSSWLWLLRLTHLCSMSPPHRPSGTVHAFRVEPL